MISSLNHLFILNFYEFLESISNLSQKKQSFNSSSLPLHSITLPNTIISINCTLTRITIGTQNGIFLFAFREDSNKFELLAKYIFLIIF